MAKELEVRDGVTDEDLEISPPQQTEDRQAELKEKPGVAKAWRRVAVLYLAGELFACRRCCALAYASQQKDPLVRNVSRSQKIRMRLGGTPDLFGPMPERPRGMWRRAYERHCAVLARIEGNLFV